LEDHKGGNTFTEGTPSAGKRTNHAGEKVLPRETKVEGGKTEERRRIQKKEKKGPSERWPAKEREGSRGRRGSLRHKETTGKEAPTFKGRPTDTRKSKNKSSGRPLLR